MGHKVKYYSLKIMATLIRPFVFLLKKQSNSFGAIILKPNIPQDLYPWVMLKDNKIVFNTKFNGKK